MEDHIISPWQNYQDFNSKPDLFTLFPKTRPSHQESTTTKSRQVFTEKDQLLDTTFQSKKFHVRITRNKGLSFSTQNFHREKSSALPKKSQIKLVSYPIHEKSKTRELLSRYSEKPQTSSSYKPQTSQFQVIQTFVSSDLKGLQIFKQRSPNKNPKFYQQNLKMKKVQKIDSIKANIYKQQSQQKCQIFNLENPLKKLNMTLDPIIFSQISHSKGDLDSLNQQRSGERLKLKVQKPENINLSKQNTKSSSILKKKNKILVNQLQRYNLFGLKNLKKNKSTQN